MAVDDATNLIGTTTANPQCEKIMEEHVAIEEDPTKLAMTDLFDARCRIFKAKPLTQQTIPSKMDAFWFQNTG